MQHACAGHRGEDGCTRNQILVAVGFEDMGDFQPGCARFLQIQFAVTARIYHRRLAAGSDQVGQV